MKTNLANGSETFEVNPQHKDDGNDVNDNISKTSPELRENAHMEMQTFSGSELVSHGQDGNGRPHFYPPPSASHRDVIRDAVLFIATLDSFLTALGTRLTIPKVKHKEIDLHAFYREVTARGGLERVIRSGCWKKVCDSLKLHRALNNRYYFLRKHYVNLLFHYEQVYFFRAEGQLVSPPVPLLAPMPVEKRMETGSPYVVTPEMSSSLKKKKRKVDPEQVFGVDPAASVGAVATGAICGKFDEGYFVTVVVGTERLSGVLYHFSSRKKAPQFASVPSLLEGIGTEGATTGLEIQLYGKKKERIKKDRSGPKRTRTGYNIYFKEQRARLKELYPGSKGLGKKVIEMWNKLPEDEKSYYNTLGNVERERYLTEYREKTKVQQSQCNDSTANGAEGSIPAAEVDHGAYYVSHDYHVSLDVENEVQTGQASVHNSEREQVYHGYRANQSLVEPELSGAHFVSEQTYEMQDDEGDYPQEPPSEEEVEDDNEAEEAFEAEEDETIYRSADKILEQQEDEEQEQGQENYACEYQNYDVSKQAYPAADAATTAVAEHAYYGRDHTYPDIPEESQASNHISSSLKHSSYKGGRDNGQNIYNIHAIHGPPEMPVTNVAAPQHFFSHDRFGFSAARSGALNLSLLQDQTTFSSRQLDANSYMAPSLHHHQSHAIASSIQTRHQLPSEQGYQDRYPYHIQMPHAQMYARPSPPPQSYAPRFTHPSYHMQWNDAEAFQHGHGGYVPQLHHPQAVIPGIAAVRPASHAYQAEDGGQTKP